EADRGDEAAERDVLDDDAWDQEVDVGVSRCRDRTAEHVPEQQHEHDRLDRECKQQLGSAWQADQIALGDDHGVRHEARQEAWSSNDPPSPEASPSPLGSSAAWPVSDMNTSSSVGRRTTRSSTPTPASLSRRTASMMLPLRWRTLTRTSVPSAVG